MWRIRFLSTHLDEVGLNLRLPVGYFAELDQAGGRYVIYDKLTLREAGSCKAVNGVATMSFDGDTETGLAFAIAWGEDYPDFNPRQMLYGYVSKSPAGLFRLDKEPLESRIDALTQLGHYASVGDSYLVAFLYGNWTEASLKVMSMKKVLLDSTLGLDEGMLTLSMEREEAKNE